jgi:hypothetical protein
VSAHHVKKEKPMLCPNCNTPSPGGGKFCINCGYQLPQAPTPVVQPLVAPTPSASPLQAGAVSAMPTWASTKVVVTDIKMSFGSMVVFMIKWSLAAIPALIILLVIAGIISAVLGGVLGGLLYGIF